jgi:hypothetical protein
MQAPEEKARGITIATAHGTAKLCLSLHTMRNVLEGARGCESS